MKIFGSICLMAVVLVALIGCSKPPEQEISAAISALEAARSAEAELYVRNAYNMAQDTLNTAMAAKKEQDGKFALFRSYSKSKNMLIRAKTLAEEATVAAQAEKERYRMEVANLITQVQARLEAVEAEVAKAPVGKGNKADIELIKNDLSATKAAFDDARKDNDAGKYISAKSKLEVVMKKADAISNEIATATARKQPTKAPAKAPR